MRVNRRSATSVLSAPVVTGRHVVGHVSELVFDRELEHLVGYEVEPPSSGRRFVPARVADAGPAGIEVASPLHLLEPDYYRQNGIVLGDARDEEGFEIDLDSGDVIRGA